MVLVLNKKCIHTVIGVCQTLRFVVREIAKRPEKPFFVCATPSLVISRGVLKNFAWTKYGFFHHADPPLIRLFK
jgi:hypothetical protein